MSFLTCKSLVTKDATFSAVDAKGNKLQNVAAGGLAPLIITSDGEVTGSSVATALAALGKTRVKVSAAVKRVSPTGEKSTMATVKDMTVTAEDAAEVLVADHIGVEIDQMALKVFLAKRKPTTQTPVPANGQAVPVA